MIWYDISMAKKSEEFKIRISNPHEVVWEGTATALSSENSQGKFDVLSQHANFITIIKEKPITLADLIGLSNLLSITSYSSFVMSSVKTSF